jgi:hypothetical protein
MWNAFHFNVIYVQRGFFHEDIVKYFVSRCNKSFGSKSKLNSGNDVVRFRCISNFQCSLQEPRAYNIHNYTFTCCFV